jgi:C-terminal processing protease CtpA/Prc
MKMAMVTPKDRMKFIKRVKTLVLKHHFNVANVDYEAWSREVDRRAPALAAADDLTFEAGVRELLAGLKSSHTNFYRSDSQPTKPQHAIGATLRSIEDDGEARWMVLDVYEESPAAVAGFRPGDILVAMDGKELWPPIEPTFRFGEIHKLVIGSLCGGGEREVSIPVPAKKPSRGRPPLVEPKSVAHQLLKPSVGLLKIPFFSGAFGFRFSKLLDGAIDALKTQGCDRLIVDLRGCLGGSLGFAHLVSYFCPGQIPIGYDITRSRWQHGYNVQALPQVPMPSTRFALLQCLLRFSVRDKSLVLMTQGLGNQPFHGRIAVLVNEWTNSAGEIAAQFAKDSKLATVIGRKTMGNALGSTMFSAGGGYKLYLPIFGWYSPDGTYLERSGVAPDVAVDIEPKELACGHDDQFRMALMAVS